MAKKKKKRNPPAKAEVPEWVLTYGDLMSLLLCFFILLAAFSELKQPREYRQALEYIQQALGFEGGLGVAAIRQSVNNSTVMHRRERAMRAGQGKHTDETVEASVKGNQSRTSVVHQDQRTAVGGSIGFAAGETELSPTAKSAIRDEIAPKMRGQKFIFTITGHAFGRDDVKLAGMQDFDELAFTRAQNVKEYLVRECEVDAAILRIETAGDTEPQTISPSGMDAWAGNRRVQVYQTGRTVEDVHPDARFTGAGGA